MNKLLVCTNPYFFIDHRGCPAGTADREFVQGRHGLTRTSSYIGARIAPDAEVERDAPPEGDTPPKLRGKKSKGEAAGQVEVGKFVKGRHHVRYVFKRGTIEVDDTRYNRRLVSEGTLLAADVATAKTCKVAFVEPEKAREEWRQRSGCKADVLWAAEATPVPAQADGK